MRCAPLHAVLAGTVFDGETRHADAAVVIEGSRIARIVPRRDLAPDLPVTALAQGAWLAPGFIDVQVNGGGDILLNDAPTAGAMAAIARAHRRFGTTALLPTLITDTPEKMHAALSAVDDAAAACPSVLGLHLEGPFISPEKPGIHNPALIRKPDARDIALLSAKRKSVTLVTLAPERMPDGFVAKLAAAGVHLCLGHSMASYDEAKAAFAAGVTGLTHLFNAMPQLESRRPGPIAAALENPSAFFGMIVDGEHVAPAMLRLALRGLAKPMLVTDAMPLVGGSKATFTLYGEEIAVREGRCTDAKGTLAGSALDMASAIKKSVRLLGVTLEEALCFASKNPARFLGFDAELGQLKPGFRADLVAFDPDTMHIHGTWVAGKRD